MNSLQIKSGSFSENSNAASLALSIKVSERVGTGFAGGDTTGGGSGQGGRGGCMPRFKMGRTSEQGGSCDCVEGGGAEGADCAGCDCGGGAWAPRTLVWWMRKSARITARQPNLRNGVAPAAILVSGLPRRACGRCSHGPN